MANSPIQIVLNSSDFIDFWDRQGGGAKKDFYAGNDEAFLDHRNKVIEQLDALRPKTSNNPYSDISYAKVILKPSALAKSHRPTSKIFKQDITPIVGGGDLGEILIELQPASIDRVTSNISKAEIKTTWKTSETGKKNAKPSIERSEVGAINEIKPYTASDKRKFTISDGINWLSNAKTGGAYLVELFEDLIIPSEKATFDQQKKKLLTSFYDGLFGLGKGIVVQKISRNFGHIPMISIRLEESNSPPEINLKYQKTKNTKKGTNSRISLSLPRHSSLINFLDKHPLVRKINLPPIISQSSPTPSKIATVDFSLPKLNPKRKYPKIGIVDGGVSDVLGDWIEARHGLLSPKDKNESHGTFIAGLVISGKELNGPAICKELDGCKIIDLDILPPDTSFEQYYSDIFQFFEELETAVRELKQRTGVRVFNFSLNIEEHASSDSYSKPAIRLDEIAESNDVIFLISAGNCSINDHRAEWPEDASEALRILASSRNDTIKRPAESHRNLSVSALNPPNLQGIVPYALTSYSCRGPATRIGLKPDLAHVGGCGTPLNDDGHGLYSINHIGQVVDDCGTSYATPNVAKSIACLEQSIEGHVARETLIGLTIHNAKVPELMLDKNFKSLAKDLVGFGIPECSDDILAGDEHSITLVFANKIVTGKRMSFSFSWPSALVQNGKCLGHARLTIVSSPPFDHKFGAEFVRINIEGHLRQILPDGSAKGCLSPVYLSSSGESTEKNRIEHSFKWSPIKVLEGFFPKGIGGSTDWRLDVEYLARDGEDLPDTGVPFTAILTITDPKKEASVFNSMRQSLQSTGVKILDIKNAAKIASRV